MVNVTVRLEDGYKTLIETRNVTAVADEPLEEGGTNLGPTPRELLLGALGACAAITARMYALRKGWALEGVEVSVSMDKLKAADYPGYTGSSENVNEFRQMIHFKGDLTDEQRERLLQIAGKCPVHRILMDDNIIIEELLTDEMVFPAEEDHIG
ncbi:MAG: OsmC family protein [Anaerolinea sp.]|nr:OsmC family protein [Anaerolinea sp.]